MIDGLMKMKPEGVDLRDADIDEENLERIEAMDELLRNAPKESRQSNWGLAQARAVVGFWRKNSLNLNSLKKGKPFHYP